ncbi:MAG: alanine racemase [Vicinamibacterales bacterium]
MTIPELPTPAVLIDKARAIRNIDRLQKTAGAHGVALRPHAKTHKSPTVAGWQLARGAVGICCAKLGEAEVFAEAGIEDIRLPYPLHPANADRVIALARRTRLSFIVDHMDIASAWSAALAAASVEVDVLVKVDVGFHRCGIDPAPATAIPFIGAVARLPGLRLAGLLSHAGHAYHATSDDHLRRIAADEAATLRDLAAKARSAGVEIRELSAGATPTARFSLEETGLTEYRAGNYVYLDRTQVGLGAASIDDCALTVLARVVSAPHPSRAVVDAGSKTLSSDGARGFTPGAGYGGILAGGAAADGPAVCDDGLTLERLSEEHGVVSIAPGHPPLAPGDLVRIVPNHACVVSNLVDAAWVVDAERIDPLTIAARGRLT